MSRYFISIYTDGPETRWNVIDRRTQEWVRRFVTEAEALAYAEGLEDAEIEAASKLSSAHHNGETK